MTKQDLMEELQDVRYELSHKVHRKERGKNRLLRRPSAILRIRCHGRRYPLPLRRRREKIYPRGLFRLLGRGRIHGTGEQRNDSEDAESELKRGEKIGNRAAVCAGRFASGSARTPRSAAPSSP